MLNYNKVFLAGRVVSDIELKTVESGKFVCLFDVAYNRDKETVYYLPCVGWEERAKFLASHFGKGAPIFLEGELTQRKWKDKDGKNHSTFVVRVTDVKFVETLEEKNARVAAAAPTAPAASAEPKITADYDDDSLPF